ncbi:Ohr family peroxiredoxin [Pararhizobium sp. BT-229]|uniref:Ohr family peroxiredoxin n=1 Tax=Pararhizobium sp. BT-229 TaxID=2986923 RepID=UPI0021F7B671|nr:Ohr family peroxiredoxin [Pararhizobium sp. BT-229]MCV9961852.1 Ohr family peroxiredoxin [Pararhizobium sp. BT-229]
MNKTMHLIYTAATKTTGGRENGVARSTDGVLDIRLSEPGSTRIGTNPEQLMAAGWSVSFASSVAQVAREAGVNLSANVKIHTEVDLSSDDDEIVIGVRLAVQLPGLERDVAATLIEEARRICPFSRATRGNVEVSFVVV